MKPLINITQIVLLYNHETGDRSWNPGEEEDGVYLWRGNLKHLCHPLYKCI